MINTVVLVGRVVFDPELRYTQNGTAVTNFRLAVNRKRKNQDGDRGADFFTCVAWSGLAEVIAEYAKKGKEMGIEGELRQSVWENDEGQKREKVEVYVNHMMFLRDGNGGTEEEEEQEEEKPKKPAAKGKAKGKKKQDIDIDIDDEDLPF